MIVTGMRGSWDIEITVILISKFVVRIVSCKLNMPDVSGRQENSAGSGYHAPSFVQIDVIV